MFAKISIFLFCAIVAAQAKVLLVKNSGSRSLVVSATGLDDVTLLSGVSTSLTVDDDWEGSVSALPVDAEVTDGPKTLAQFTLGDSDSYAVSLLDGFNVRAKIIPIQGTNCQSAICYVNLNNVCPTANQVKNSSDVTVACSNSPTIMSAKCPNALVSSDDTTTVFTCSAVSYLVMFTA